MLNATVLTDVTRIQFPRISRANNNREKKKGFTKNISLSRSFRTVK